MGGGLSNIAAKGPGDIESDHRLAVLGLKEGEVPNLLAIANLINSGKVNNIVCLCGAGISVSAGIPDFRSKGTGLYDNLEKYNLPSPESIFDIEYFKRNPKPFTLLAKELLPGKAKPTPTHYFLKLLENKGKLLRIYTQNIDGLEYAAGLSEDKVIQCHGGMRSCHCIKCDKVQSNAAVFADIEAGKESRCSDKACAGLCKPAITFFGENLPPSFALHKNVDFSRYQFQCCTGGCKNRVVDTADGASSLYCLKHHRPQALASTTKADSPVVSDTTNNAAEKESVGSVVDSLIEKTDKEKTKEKESKPDMGPVVCKCDLMIVMGTSLSVHPVAGLVDDVHWLCPRLLMNREVVHAVGEEPSGLAALAALSNDADCGFRFDLPDNYRDVACLEDCDTGVEKFAALLGWEEELKALVSTGPP